MPDQHPARPRHSTPQTDPHRELPTDPDVVDEDARWPLHFRASAVGLVAAGGVLGTLGRHGLTLLDPGHTGQWPWATFVANLAGAFILGALLEVLTRLGPDDGWRRQVRILTGTGFCGGLTTYSTFAVDVDLLLRDHATGVAVGYAAATVTGGLVTTVAGIAVAARWHARRRAGLDAEAVRA